MTVAKHTPNRQARAKRYQAHTALHRWLWVGVAVLGLVAIAAAINYWPGARGAPELSAERLASDPTLGPASAPITLVEYGDFG